MSADGFAVKMRETKEIVHRNVARNYLGGPLVIGDGVALNSMAHPTGPGIAEGTEPSVESIAVSPSTWVSREDARRLLDDTQREHFEKMLGERRYIAMRELARGMLDAGTHSKMPEEEIAASQARGEHLLTECTTEYAGVFVGVGPMTVWGEKPEPAPFVPESAGLDRLTVEPHHIAPARPMVCSCGWEPSQTDPIKQINEAGEHLRAAYPLHLLGSRLDLSPVEMLVYSKWACDERERLDDALYKSMFGGPEPDILAATRDIARST